MAGLNRATILGRLGQDPDIRFTQTGDVVATLSIATSITWNDKASGEKKEKTEWHRCVAFGRTAEIAQQYLHKGRQVYVEGRLQTRKWQSQDGTDRYSTEIIIETMQLLGDRPAATGQDPASARVPRTPAAAPDSASQNAPFDDDIPF